MEQLDDYTLDLIIGFNPNKSNRLVCRKWAAIIAQLPVRRHQLLPHQMPVSWFHSPQFDSIFWMNLPRDYRLHTDFMTEFADRIYWHNACFHQKIEGSLIDKFPEQIDWHRLGMNSLTPDDCRLRISDPKIWKRMSECGNLSEWLIEVAAHLLDWNVLLKNQILTGDMILKYIDKIDWEMVKYKYEKTMTPDQIQKINKKRRLT